MQNNAAYQQNGLNNAIQNEQNNIVHQQNVQNNATYRPNGQNNAIHHAQNRVGNDPYKYDQYKEAVKTRRQLCQNPNTVEKFDSEIHSIGYFIKSRIAGQAKTNELTRVQDVAPWIPHAFPRHPRESIERGINFVKLTVDDSQLDLFLLRLARYLSPKGQGVLQQHKVRKEFETILMYVDRMYIEYDCVVDSEQEIVETKLIQQISKDIYSYLKLHEKDNVRQMIKHCVAQDSLEPISSKQKLEILAKRVDDRLIDTPTTSIQISAFSRPKTQQTSFRHDNAVIPNPQVSPRESTTKICEFCEENFVPEHPKFDKCKRCYKLFLVIKESVNNKKQERGRSSQRSSSNNRNRSNSNSKRQSFRPNSRNSKFSAVENKNYNLSENTDNRTLQQPSEEISTLSDALTGSEVPLNPVEFSSDKVMASAIGKAMKMSRDRVCLEFQEEQSRNTGNGLVDSGANTDGMTSQFVHKAGLTMIDRTEGFAKDFQGNPCKTKGKVKASIQLGRVFYDSTFTVFESKNPHNKIDIILGTPFLARYGVDDVMRSHISHITGDRCVLVGEPGSKN